MNHPGFLPARCRVGIAWLFDGHNYLKGGGTQITFKDESVWKQARPNRYNNYAADPYLEVVGIKPLGN